MNKQKALLMDDPKHKLAKLKEFIPDASDTLYDFGHFLVDYLSPKLVPMEFVMVCELALHDLQIGMNGFTNKPIQSRLVGYPTMIYALLRNEIPRIADAIFPAEFADGVKAFIKEVDAKQTK
jgi:hypothetical protein